MYLFIYISFDYIFILLNNCNRYYIKQKGRVLNTFLFCHKMFFFKNLFTMLKLYFLFLGHRLKEAKEEQQFNRLIIFIFSILKLLLLHFITYLILILLKFITDQSNFFTVMLSIFIVQSKLFIFLELVRILNCGFLKPRLTSLQMILERLVHFCIIFHTSEILVTGAKYTNHLHLHCIMVYFASIFFADNQLNFSFLGFDKCKKPSEEACFVRS